MSVIRGKANKAVSNHVFPVLRNQPVQAKGVASLHGVTGCLGQLAQLSKTCTNLSNCLFFFKGVSWAQDLDYAYIFSFSLANPEVGKRFHPQQHVLTPIGVGPHLVGRFSPWLWSEPSMVPNGSCCSKQHRCVRHFPTYTPQRFMQTF